MLQNKTGSATLALPYYFDTYTYCKGHPKIYDQVS